MNKEEGRYRDMRGGEVMNKRKRVTTDMEGGGKVDLLKFLLAVFLNIKVWIGMIN